MKAGSNAGEPAIDFRKRLVNKTALWKFMGRELAFDLSHALFSSFDIDAGSKLLLKSVAQRIPLERMRTALDMGCGVGVLGLSVKARFPHISVLAVDRDALALDFARNNAAKNGLSIGKEEDGFTLSGSVGLMHLPVRLFDLVLSNIPAKAGPLVIENWLTGFTALLDTDGVLAFVIVKTLAETVRQALESSGYEVVWREVSREHAVFHARKTKVMIADRTLTPYRRGRMTLPAAGGPLELTTVTGLPEFDTLSFSTKILQKITGRIECAGNVLLWNPGQGQLAALLLRRFGRRITSLTLAGRDLLSLETSRRNCQTAGVGAERLVVVHEPSLFALKDTFDRIIMVPDQDSGFPWYEYLLPSVLPRLTPPGMAAVAAKSSFLGRADLPRRVRLLQDVRSKGFRGVAFQDH